VLRCRALLFDLDGTLIDSVPATERAWRRWAEHVGADWPALREAMHGVPTRQVIADFAPHLDAVAEAEALEAAQGADTEGVAAMPGAVELVSGLPARAWAIVTSGTTVVARPRIEAAGIPEPPVLITSQDVERGKPDPAPFLLAARRLGVDPADAAVVEDAPAGIAAGIAGGFPVVAVGSERRKGVALHVTGVGRLRVEAGDGVLEVRGR
jgi:sugar-phosphatase